MELENFWNDLFEELPTYNDKLHAMRSPPQLKNINVNKTIGQIFNHLQNCPITINYVTTPKSIL
jgi:hypothetical protein